MPGQMTIKKLKLRGRARRRRTNLKVDAPTFNVKETLEMKNYEVIQSLSAKVKQAQAQ